MKIYEPFSLRHKNTFGIDVQASSFISIESLKELLSLCQKSTPHLVLGGGSNVLLLNDIDGEVWSYDAKGIDILNEHEDHILLEVQSGEIWHDLVMWAVDNDYGGIENLALIPGKCGAAPIQNIGAYGVEIKDVLHSVHAVQKSTGRQLAYHNQSCQFAYRDSIFKNALKDQLIITSIVLKLTKPGHHILNTSYGAISKILDQKNINNPSIKDVAETVIAIRSSKLPDVHTIGNAGSFFKNPIIPKSQFEDLQIKFPNIVSYPVDDAQIKLPAAWLIDKAGWKGKSVGGASCYEKQALVLINKNKATGADVYELSSQIIESVKSIYGIELEREVNLIS